MIPLQPMRLSLAGSVWKGNAWFAGDVYVKGDNQDNGKKLLSTSDIYFNENGELVVTINGVTKTFTPKA